MVRRISERMALYAGTALVALAAPPALAQDTPAPAVTGGNDIVVTARRRAESLQDVPIAITAISGAALEASGTQDITALAQTVPNITVEATRGSNTTLAAFIRGVGQQDPVAGFEAGVGLYLDDVYLNRPQGSVLDVFDVDRIEVLRGPQGTLYGRNTIGGAIKYVTKRLNPNDAELNVRLTGGSYKQADAVVSGSLPVSPQFRIGFAAARLTRDGFGRNLNTGQQNYDKDVLAFRYSAEIEPTDRFLMRIAADYTRDDSSPKQGARLIPGLFSGAPVLASAYDTRAGLQVPRQHIYGYGVSATALWKASDAISFKNILAYRADRTQTPIDFDSLPARDVDVPAIYRNRQFSEEFQLLYTSRKLNGIVGVYYLDANAFDVFDTVLGLTGTLLNLPGFTASTLGNVDTKTYSVFGDFTYDVTPWLSVSGGGRYTYDKRTSIILRRNLLNGQEPALGGTGVQFGGNTSDFNGAASFTRFTPRASISVKPSANHNIYASYARGFKGGGFDPRGLTTAAPDTNRNGVKDPQEIFDFLSFDPETVDTYELGYKAQLFDRHLNLSADVFHSDYTDVQVPGSFGFDSNGDGINDTFVGVTTNAGKARINGAELEANAHFADGFAGEGSRIGIGGSVGYIDAKYKVFIGPTGANVAAQRVFQNTPSWTASGFLSIAVPIAGGMADLTPSLSYRSTTAQFETASLLDQPGYTLFDASLNWKSAGGRWSLGVHGKNLTDRRYITSGYVFVTRNATTGVYTSTLGREGILTAFYGPPRQIYATLGFKF
jgi:iron complex outermembrane recepter protein